MSERGTFPAFNPPALPALREEMGAGWRGRLSKWQLALLIGMPIATAATLLGVVLLLRRRRRSSVGEGSPPSVSSLSPTPVASPVKSQTKSPLDDAKQLKSQGNGYYKEEKFHEAARCYEEAIRLSVGAGEKNEVVAIYHQNLGAVYDALARKESNNEMKVSYRQIVIQNCGKAIALNPRYVKALLRRYQMHFALNNWEEALLDVTRVLLLDESQAQTVSSSVPKLLKVISINLACDHFPQLGPLAPTKQLLKTFNESYVWQDDLSTERLKSLWLESHPSTPDAQVSQTQATSEPQGGEETEGEKEGEGGEVENEGREDGKVDEGEEKEVEGEDGEEETEREGVDSEKKEEEEGEGEQPIVNGEELGTEGEEKRDQPSEEGEGDTPQESGDKLEEEKEVVEKKSKEEMMAGFDQEPFVVAVAQLRRCELGSILAVLGDAIDKGDEVFKAHALLLRGCLHSLWRMEKEALKDLQEVINMDGLPKEMYVDALIKKASVFAGGMEMEKCKTCFEKAVAISPTSPDILIHRARVGLETEEPSNLASVMEDLEKAVKLVPNFPYGYFTLASSYHRMASVSQSMQLVGQAQIKFQDAVKKFPNFVDGLILYSLFLQDINDIPTAEEILKKAVELEPDNPLAHFSLGLLHLVAKSDITKTVQYMEKAIEVDCSCVQAYDTLASIEMQQGNTARGVELYEKAIQFSRNQMEMAQAYVAKKIFSVQEQVCREYGVPINLLQGGANPFSRASAP